MPDLLVLCYHAVSPVWPAPLSLAPEALERQVGHLLGRGYRFATLADAVLGPARGRTAVITFDDAFRSVARLAHPVLAAAGVPATVFAPTSFVDRGQPLAWPGTDRWLGGPYEAELAPMSWAELGELADAGWEIGSHTCTHPRLTTLGGDELARELTESRARLEAALGRACRSFAYPYGDVDARVVRAVGAAGYEAAVTLPVRFERREPLTVPRVGVYRADGPRTFALKTSRAVRALRRAPGLSRARTMARRLRP